MSTRLDIRQVETRVLQDQLNSAIVTEMDSTLASINNELTTPGRLIATSTPSLVVTLGSGTVVNPNTSKNRVLPQVSNASIPFTGGTITFPSTSGNITPSVGPTVAITIGASQFVAVLVQLDTSGNIQLSVGTAAGTLSAASIPPGNAAYLSLGYIIAESNASSVIQNITNAMLYQYVGGGGSGGGSGSGSKNYLGTVNNVNGNGNFELGSTSGWSLFTTTLTGVIPTGTITAGAGTITTFAATASNPLAGTYSLNVGSTGVINAGQGFISQPFTLDSEDKAKVLSQKFYYSVLSGATNLNFSGTSSNTWAVYFYDVANSAWVQPAGVYNLIQNSGSGISTGTFQTALNATQYRIAIICVNASAGASSMLFDDFSVSPQTIVNGASITDWNTNLTFTPSASFGTTTNSRYFSRMVGDTLWVEGYYTFGTTTASTAFLTLPTGYSIDYSKVFSTLGEFWILTSSGTPSPFGTNNAFGAVVADGTTTNELFFAFASNSTGYTKAFANALGASGISIGFKFSVPILGKSSNTLMSNDTDTRLVAAYYTGSPITGTLNGSLNPAIYGNKVQDTHAAYNTTTGIYTIPVTGSYDLAAGFSASISGSTIGQDAQICVFLNGVKLFRNDLISTGTGEMSVNVPLAINAYPFKAGDQLQVQIGVQQPGPVYTADTTINFLSISRRSGPATIAASESVNAIYNTSTTSAINGSSTTIVYTNKVKDTHGAYNTSTGIYTIPVSGTYLVSAMCSQAINIGAGQGTWILVTQTGSNSISQLLSQQFAQVTGTLTFGPGGAAQFSCLAGDTLRVQFFNGATNNGTATSGAPYQQFSVCRVGN